MGLRTDCDFAFLWFCSLDFIERDYALEVVSFHRSGDVDLDGIPKHWPDYMNRDLRNLPRCWSQEDDANAHRHKFSGNLLAAFIRTQQASVYLERAREQAESDLRRVRELRKNYSDQSRLMVTTREAQKKAEERAGLLEAANVGLVQKVAELEEKIWAGEDRYKAEVDGVLVAMARLEEEIAFLRLILSLRLV